MNWLRKFVCFCVLVDESEVKRLNGYDRSLVTASFIRQVLGALFVFILFFFAGSKLMPDVPIIIVGVVTALLALIIFFLDQAIIGSEWTMHRQLVAKPLYNGFLNFLMKIFVLTPRVLYAVVLALFMAHWAEMAIQRSAIDRVLNERTRENNAEYFQRINEQASEHEAQLKVIALDIATLEEAIRTKTDPAVQQIIQQLEAEAQGFSSNINNQSSVLVRLKQDETTAQAKITSLEAELALRRSEISSLTAVMKEEINDPNRCSSPGADFCKGPRWDTLNLRLIGKQNSIGPIEASLIAERKRVSGIRSQAAGVKSSISSEQGDAQLVATKLRNMQQSTTSLSDLEVELDTKIEIQASLISRHRDEADKLDELLISAGIRDFAEYGPLDRRVGLAELHNHPVYGEVSRNFSWELKVVIILFELSPVLVTVFFAPFSFLGMRMRERREQEEISAQQKTKILAQKNIRSTADLEVAKHRIGLDAARIKAIAQREFDAKEARDIDVHEVELTEFDKNRMKRNSDMSENRDIHGFTDTPTDPELEKIKLEIQKEELREYLGKIIKRREAWANVDVGNTKKGENNA